METANHTTMHVTETKTLCSSLTCPQSKSEELTKYQEEDLLCGNSEDGDEEDALSDDSMRLRLSDDETELDEPATSEDVIIKKADQEVTNMELGSDVPTTDTSEQINALRVQKPANGICTIESENLSDNQEEDQESNDDFTEDPMPSSDNFIHSSDSSIHCNGVSSQIGSNSIEETSITEMQSNNSKFSGHFGKYSNRANRVSQSRISYIESNKFATDPYTDKYYNKNTYYGGGKGSGRAYTSYIRESLTCEETAVERDSLRVHSPSTVTKDSETAPIPEVPYLPIKSEFPTVKPLDSENGFSNNVESESSEPNKTEDSVNNGEDANGLTKDVDDNVDDNAAATSHVDNLVSEKVSDNLDRSQESLRADSDAALRHRADSDADHEAVVNPEFENANASISSASTLVLDDLNNSVAERLSEVLDVAGEEESPSASLKDSKVEPVLNSEEANLCSDEANLAAKEVDRKSEEAALNSVEADLNSGEANLNLGEADFNSSNADSNSKAADSDIDKITESVVSERTDERTKEEPSSEFSDGENTVEEEVVVEEIETITTEEVESGETDFLDQIEAELVGESEKYDYAKEVDDKKPQVNEPTELESRNSESSAKGMENSQDQTAVLSATPKKSTDGAISEHALKEPSIVMTSDCETAERSAVSADKETPSDHTILNVEDHIADLPDEKETSSEDEGESSNVRIQYTSLKRTSTESLDEMELFKRMRIQRMKSEIDVSSEKNITEDVASSVKSDVIKSDVINKTNNSASTVVNPVTNSIADSKSSSESEASLISNTVVENLSDDLIGQPKEVKLESGNSKKTINKVDDCEVVEVPMKRKQKRNKRSLQTVRDPVVNQEDTQEKENVRQKRRTAKNAEEIIRKEFLGHSDSESNDSTGNLVAVNYNKSSNNLRAASPPSLKRSYIEEEEKPEKSTTKKLKQDLSSSEDVSTNVNTPAMTKTQTLAHVRNFFRRDDNGKLAKLKQEELEELLIQKVVETITMRDEIGKLREQAKISERNQEATRLRCQQLAKQIKDFEMVLNRFQSDRRSNPDKTVVPIKINRSVGLQVNFVTQEHGIQNLRQLAQTQKTAPPIANGTSSPQQSEQPLNTVPIAKRTVKVRSPRRPDPPAPVPTVTTVSTPVHTQPIISNITPAALVVTKNATDSRTPVTPTTHHTTVPHPIAPKQTILVNGPITSQPIRQATAIQVSRTTNNDLIDLTQEEDKTKTTVVPQNTILATTITETPSSIPNVQKIAPRYHTVIQTLPGSVAITAQPGIRVVQPSSQPTPTALVNNMNAPRLAYVMQGGMGSTRQVVVTSAPAPIRPTPAIRTSYPLSGTITNGTVRVIPMTSTATLQVYKHPAALPESLNSPSNPSWKLPPPAPSLKISKVTNGIVLSWNMALSDKYADIASYQLYAYQEVSGIAPSSTLWKKVGDVRALPLPMACTLTQFSEGNNYYFAVRAVDKHSRLGLYSQPGNISL